MKVALILDGPLDQVSGGYLYDRQLVDHLRSQGDEVTLLSLATAPYIARWLSPVADRALARLNGDAFDVLLEDELSHPALIGLNRALRRSGRMPIISIVHHLRSSEPWPRLLTAFFRLVERRYLQGVDGFVFNSHATRRVVEALVGESAPSVVAPPAGDRLQPSIAEDAIRSRARQPGPLRLLFVGNLIRRKGLLTLLAAVRDLSPSLARLQVVGDERFERGFAATLRKHIAREGLQDRVELMGPLYNQALAARMAVSHVLVVPSHYEGFGIAYLEGMGFGLPAIGGAAGGAAEIIRDGVNGFLIDPGAPDQLAHRIRRLAEDRSRLEEMSLAARRTYAAHPTWSHTGDIIRRFLTQRVLRPSWVPSHSPKEEVV